MGGDGSTKVGRGDTWGGENAPNRGEIRERSMGTVREGNLPGRKRGKEGG